MKGDSIILVMFSALLGVLMAFGIAYLIERIREAQGEGAEEYEEYSVPARKRRSERLSELRYAAAVLRDMKKKTKTPPAEKSPKPSSGARKAKSGKVVSFNAGRAKYGKK